MVPFKAVTTGMVSPVPGTRSTDQNASRWPQGKKHSEGDMVPAPGHFSGTTYGANSVPADPIGTKLDHGFSDPIEPLAPNPGDRDGSNSP